MVGLPESKGIVISKIKIIFVINDAGFFLSHRLPLAVGARNAGYDVHVATPEGKGVERIVGEGFTHHVIRLNRGGTSVLRELDALRSLYKLFKKERPDIVHNVTIKPVIYGGIVARIAGVPSVVSAVSGLGHVFISNKLRARSLRLLLNPLYRTALNSRRSKVILQNPDDKDLLVRQGILKEKNAVLIRGSGVDVKKYLPSAEPSGLPVITLASRMLWDKGVGEFVRAARILKNENVNARFVLVGGVDSCNPAGITKNQLEEWVREGVVEWWGHRDDILEVFKQTHVVCLPSYREGVPKVLIEAAACAKPIVATDVAGCREIAIDGVNALLVPVYDEKSIANALKQLIGNAVLRSEMGRRGREMVEKYFTVEKVLDATLGVYNELSKDLYS